MATTTVTGIEIPQEDLEKLPKLRPTAIVHRTPWRPPTAVSSKGIWITLEDGQELADAAGGAAVTCLGHGHPGIIAAIQEQATKMSCAYAQVPGVFISGTDFHLDD